VKWSLKSADPIAAERLSSQLQADPALHLKNDGSAAILSRLLLLRGIEDEAGARRFLHPSLSDLHSPYLMTGMKAAVERLEAAIERKETILIYGDYDVDGTTAIVILKAAIELCGGAVDFHVPHRIRDGYDMRENIIERAASEGIRLIVSVDMGIRAFAPAETAARLGVDLILTDHHLPGPDGVPRALAVLNPNQAACDYPCKALCGAGVAFKLAQALMKRRLAGRDQPALLRSFLKMAAIATIADSVPLIGENRIIAGLGLAALRSAVNPGLKGLLEVAQLSGRPLTTSEVAFRIAPRINAAGRMDVARDVIDLFSVKDEGQARLLAGKLDRLNSDRQEEEKRILDAITARFEQEPALLDAFCLVIDGDGWHRGVIGITATRVVERYGRPTLVVSRDGEEAHGSGRSIHPFHLLNALESCSELFTRYGGHSHAVGFSLPTGNLPQLCARLDAYARARLTLADFEPILEIDAELTLDQVTPELYRTVHLLEPFGSRNPEPVFSASHVRLVTPPKIVKERHAKLKLARSGKLDSKPSLAASPEPACHPDSSAVRREERRPGNLASRTDAWKRALTYEAMGWRMAERIQQAQLLPGDFLDIAFTLGKNDHADFGGLELSLRDFQAQSSALPKAVNASSDRC